MGYNSKKASKWEEIPEETQNKIIELRKNEIEQKNRSGYTKWFNYFTTGALIYSFAFYHLYYKKKLNTNNLKIFIFFPAPILIYGFVLRKLFFEKEAFKEYCQTHLELNRIIKKTAKSSLY